MSPNMQVMSRLEKLRMILIYVDGAITSPA